MIQMILVLFLTLLFSSVRCNNVCEKYEQEIRSEEAIQQYGTFLVCVSEKSATHRAINQKVNDVKTITSMKKTIFDTKFECFTQMAEPSEDLKNLAQCWKNYYEAKFEVDISVPLLANQQIGTDSQNWGDYELEQSVSQKRKELRDPTNIALLFTCSLAGVGLLSCIFFFIYKKLKSVKPSQPGFSQFENKTQPGESKELNTV